MQLKNFGELGRSQKVFKIEVLTDKYKSEEVRMHFGKSDEP
jgi:hypothetical protein